MGTPKAFISYSHDSQEHKKWVLDFGTRLRNSGVDAILDQWDLQPGDDIPRFMERNLVATDRILMICTSKYVEKANAGKGGVGYEKMILTADLLKSIDSNKVIPIIKQSGTHDLPTFLKAKLFIDFSRPDQFEFSFDELLRTLHNAPLFIKPPIGNIPFTPIAETQPQRSGDTLRELMKLVVHDFERQQDYTSYSLLIQRTSISRVLLDIAIEDAVAEGLLTKDNDGDLYLTKKGKHYAITNKLHKSGQQPH